MRLRPARLRAMICCAGFALIVAGGATRPGPELRPDLNGSRVRAPGQATVYLIDGGFRRGVPDVATYEALFRDWECIIDDIDPETIRPGDPLAAGTSLIREAGQAAVYFVDGTTRRHVAGPQTMDKYRFEWSRVKEVTHDELTRWPDGPKLR
jgi:hypothetical protein